MPRSTISPQAVSKHLKVLERAGLISRGRRAQLRPSRLQGAALRDASEWVDLGDGRTEMRFLATVADDVAEAAKGGLASAFDRMEQVL